MRPNKRQLVVSYYIRCKSIPQFNNKLVTCNSENVPKIGHGIIAPPVDRNGAIYSAYKPAPIIPKSSEQVEEEKEGITG